MAIQTEKDVGAPLPLLRLLVHTIPILIALLMVAMGIAAWIERDAPKGTYLWLTTTGLSTAFMIGYSLFCGGAGIALHHWMRLDKPCGVLFALFVSSPWVVFSISVVVNNIFTSHLGSIVSLVSQVGGVLMLFTLLAMSSMLAIWLEYRRATTP